MRKWHKRTRVKNATERNLAFALSEMSRMCSQLGLSRSVQETASKIYRQVVKGGLIRGRSIEGVISAVLYVACREADVPRTLEEVTEVTVRNRYKEIVEKLSEEITP